MDEEKELEEKFTAILELSFNKDSVAHWSLLRRILVYTFYSLFIFIMALFSIAKKIIFFRFLQIPKVFVVMKNMDAIIRNHFTI